MADWSAAWGPKLVAEVKRLRAQLAERDAWITELKADVQRGYEWQRGYADRLVEAQAQVEAMRGVVEAARSWYRDFTDREAWIATGKALAALDQAHRPHHAVDAHTEAREKA